MKPLIIVFLLCVAFLLQSCGFIKTKTEVVTETKREYVTIPGYLLEPCQVSIPPEKNYYKGSDYQAKEELLTDYSLDLLTDLENCNTQLKGIMKFQDKQIKIIEGIAK